VVRVSIRVKAKPVATLSILAINMAKPEYCSLISLFVKLFHLHLVGVLLVCVYVYILLNHLLISRKVEGIADG
jgi:hypothetical protein